ncbi:MAG: glutathione S-transferase N-terminal domain-containing protein [Rhodospirillales bacterium]|nr:glutathione S-transferase N-terminal domain-containing protein [Rhodospirillales bacterium]
MLPADPDGGRRERTVKLYYSPGACSLAPHIVLEEIGEPFEAVRVPIGDGAHRQPAYLAINPHGRIPALEIDGTIITEAPAILAFLARHRPDSDLLPADPVQEGKCLEFLAWLSSSVHTAYAQVRRPERYVDDEPDYPPVMEKGRANIARHFAEIESILESGPYAVAGRYTVVDPFLLVFYHWGVGRYLSFDMARDYPAWTQHADALLARPAVQRALAREGIAIR